MYLLYKTNLLGRKVAEWRRGLEMNWLPSWRKLVTVLYKFVYIVGLETNCKFQNSKMGRSGKPLHFSDVIIAYLGSACNLMAIFQWIVIIIILLLVRGFTDIAWIYCVLLVLGIQASSEELKDVVTQVVPNVPLYVCLLFIPQEFTIIFHEEKNKHFFTYFYDTTNLMSNTK